jgi:pimeloyl-ACP methyl ester carboxylesterase
VLLRSLALTVALLLSSTGPDLRLDDAQLARGLDCGRPEPTAGDRVVLLIHGTGLDAATNWSWGYQPALEARGYRVCTVDLFGNGLVDAQVSAERVVFAIREVSQAAGGPIGVVGFSQGASTARFALRFWPDLREDVEDLVLLGAPISGTTALEGLCARACAAALWQVRVGSRFLAATNTEPLVAPSVDTTSIYTYADAVVIPNDTGQASTLPGATNVAVQDVCPADASDHLELGTVDPVAFALAFDALDHAGPADRSRLPSDVCGTDLLPGLDRATADAHLATARKLTITSLTDAALVTSEPDLQCFASGTCEPEVADGGERADAGPNGSSAVPRALALGLVVLGLGAGGIAAVRAFGNRPPRSS